MHMDARMLIVLVRSSLRPSCQLAASQRAKCSLVEFPSLASIIVEHQSTSLSERRSYSLVGVDSRRSTTVASRLVRQADKSNYSTNSRSAMGQSRRELKCKVREMREKAG